MPLYSTPDKNFVQKTLDAQLDAAITASMTLNNATDIPNEAGVCVVDRIDANGNPTVSKREVIVYTGVSGNTLTGLTRNADSSGSDQDHAVGAVVEFVPDVLWGKAIREALANLVDTSTLAVDTTKVVTPTGTQTLTNKTLTSPTISTATLSGDTDLDGATDNITVNGSDPYRTIVLTSPALKPTTTGGCATVTTVEAGTNDIDYQVLDFDASTDEKAFINFNMPDSWDGGTITARFVWTAASSSGDVIWGIQGRSYANDDAIDQALGTAQTVTDTLTATGDVCISDATSAVTLAGTPAGGQMVHLRVYRDADAGGDTLAADARLIAVHIEYQVGQFGD